MAQSDEEEEEPLLKLEDGVRHGDPSPPGTSSLAQATFNMVNIFVGLGLLSMPWAMREAGWLGLLFLALSVSVFALSGSLLVRCFDKLPPGAAETYPSLGTAALGPAGLYWIGCFAILEFFGGGCGLLVVMWQELASFLTSVPNSSMVTDFPSREKTCADVAGLGPLALAALVSSAATAPVLLIPSFRRLAGLSLAGCAASVVVLGAVVAAVAADPGRGRMPEQPPAAHSWARWGVPQAMGVFALSVSGHSSLPALRRSLRRPQEFDRVLVVAFAFMFLVYGAVAGLGYAYWGDRAAVLLTSDLQTDSVFTGTSLLGTGVSLDGVVRAAIFVKAFTTYPSIVLVIQDLLWAVLPRRTPRGAWAAAACRLAVLALGCCVAWVARFSLGAVLSLVGGFCSLTCSLLFPTLCYLRLRGSDLGRGARAALLALLGFGACLLVLIVGQDLWALRFQAGQQTRGSHRGGGGSPGLESWAGQGLALAGR